MKLSELQALLDSGEFHHATDKPTYGCFSGLWIYKKDPNALRGLGFSVAGCFSTYKGDSPDYEAAYALVRHTGVSVGSRGNG